MLGWIVCIVCIGCCLLLFNLVASGLVAVMEALWGFCIITCCMGMVETLNMGMVDIELEVFVYMRMVETLNLRYLCTIILNFSSFFSHTSYNGKVAVKNKNPKNYFGIINNLANVKIYLTNLQIYLTNFKIYLTKTFSRKFNDMIRYYLAKTNFA